MLACPHRGPLGSIEVDMNGKDSEIRKGRAVLAYGAIFIFTLLVARLIVDSAQYGILIRKDFWLTLSAWIVPIGFALIGCYAYWYRTRK